ncbi:hypothetical protein M407DRAFT_8421 [Tulasnella calospora MUT 4182]|uniref:Uncharacterized protein n=1 Tax=Tulasnella calospora MUT 4182 TaxID=1051891 RepID=A0A0C3QHY4_9AGAM|nr:hypothetical protein M407DRAFT_8421 [Tulasnella calospora MUT 4182]
MEGIHPSGIPLQGHDHHSCDHKLLHNVLKAMELFMKDKDRTPETPDDPERPNETFHGDNRIQKESIHDRDHRLEEFMRAVRSLGSSSQLILSALELQRRMVDILEVFRSNALSIFTTFAESDGQELPDIFQSNSPHRGLKSFQDRKQFPELLADISEELGDFLKSLSDMPEFSDKNSPTPFWRSRAGLFTERIRAMERYENSLMLEISQYMTETGKALAYFAKDGKKGTGGNRLERFPHTSPMAGVIAIKGAQDRSKEQLLNMSTVATFFSGVSGNNVSCVLPCIGYNARPWEHLAFAPTVVERISSIRISQLTRPFALDKYTSTDENSPLGQAVPALWVSSLILSIASAINAQLAMHWRAAMYRSPRSALPIYDIDNQRVSAVVPVWGDARHVTVSRNGKFALISYAAPVPPELWRIRVFSQGSVSLELCHMYLPPPATLEGAPSTTEFVGQARFGGDSDEYIVAATKKGEVYIWDTQSSQLCHVAKDVRNGYTNSQVMGIGWCPTNEERRVPMFGCGLLEDVEIVIWRGKGQDNSAESREAAIEIERDPPRSGSGDVDAPPDGGARAGPSRTQTMS